MDKDSRLKAAMICGAGHSGSTLLGMVLGSHSRAFYMGEGAKVRFLGDHGKPQYKRVCKICGTDCPIWGTFRWQEGQPLYAQVASRSGRRVIIDSTKNVTSWIPDRVAETWAAGGVACLFLLKRDGRAVFNSRLRKYPDRDPERLVRDWMAQIEASQAYFDGFDGPKLCIHYEAFATRPEIVARQACAVLDLPYEPAMLAYETAEHHPLGGNNGPQFLAARHRPERTPFVSLHAENRQYYEDHDAGIRLDMRWKDQLSAAHLGLFERIAGHLNLRNIAEN